jgi:signal transduction histidine kinase
MGLSHVEMDEALERLGLEVDELRAARERTALAHDAERRSLERELHDGTQQHLVTLAVNIQLARELVQRDPGAAVELLDDMGRVVQRALEETVRLAQRIYPPLLEAGGLAAALRAAAMAADTQTEISASNVRLSPETAGAVYFCWLDALTSTSTSTSTSDARLATVAVSADDGAATFELGGSAASVSDDVLARMRDRVEALGGKLTTESRPAGTVLHGSLPLVR